MMNVLHISVIKRTNDGIQHDTSMTAPCCSMTRKILLLHAVSLDYHLSWPPGFPLDLWEEFYLGLSLARDNENLDFPLSAKPVLIPEMTFVGVESRALIPETTFVGVESRVLIPETTVWDTLVYPSDTLVIRKQKLE
ncbi:hypothetical protein Tco_0803782 [Tanacetum coccineum]|uniref:Uncharacterized protein n=1 Tax=Tanacetum coccineum TaxID=301880 RepID=A0ABQ5A2J0_9ASTR